MNYKNYILFGTPSFCEGISRILDIGSIYDRYNKQSDTSVIYGDWEMVGKDLKKVIGDKKKK
jgi:hypothetical protein